MITYLELQKYDSDWRQANTDYLKRKAEGMEGDDLEFLRSVALLRAQLRAVAYLYKNSN